MKTPTSYSERQANRAYRAWKQAARKTHGGTTGKAKRDLLRASDRIERAHKIARQEFATTA